MKEELQDLQLGGEFPSCSRDNPLNDSLHPFCIQSTSGIAIGEEVIADEDLCLTGNSSLSSISNSQDDVFPFLSLPSPAMRNVLVFLRYAECRSLYDAIPYRMISQLCAEESRRINRIVQKYDDCRWTRELCATTGNGNWEHVAKRVGHSVAYLHSENAMYLFGGTVVNDNNDYTINNYQEHCNAGFNDMWKLDLATMKFSRVFVCTSPYPQPKFNAVMVVYKNELILYGGHQPAHFPSYAMYRNHPQMDEMHIFNPKTCVYRYYAPINDAPRLSSACGVVVGDLFILFGGFTTPRTMNTSFRVLDLKAHKWFTPTLPGVTEDTMPANAAYDAYPNGGFPLFECGSTSLIHLKDSSLLLLGEPILPYYVHSYGVVVTFDPQDPENRPWKWRVIKVSGKWAEEKVTCQNHVSSVRSKNAHYPKVVALRTPKMIRLITVGLPLRIYRLASTRLAAEYEIRNKRHRSFVDFVSNSLAAEMERRDQCYRYNEPENDEKTDITLENDGLKCKLKNVFITREEIIVLKKLRIQEKTKTVERVEIVIEIDPVHPSQVVADLDEADRYDMVKSVLQQVYKLHIKHYTCQMRVARSMIFMKPRLQPKPRCISFTAAIPLLTDWTPEMVGDIQYVPGSSYLRAPPPTSKFELCAGRGEVILHGGTMVTPQDSNPGVSFTYLITPSPSLGDSKDEPRLSL